MLADLIHRRLVRDGPEEIFGRRLVSQLERKPAGVLLAALRELGYGDETAKEIAAVIDGRNNFIHRLFEDPGFIEVIAVRAGVESLVARVETVVEEIYVIVKKLEPEVTAESENVFGRSGSELLKLMREIDPSDFADEEERRQLEAIQRLPDDLIDE